MKNISEKDFYNLIKDTSKSSDDFMLLDSLAGERMLTRAAAAHISHEYIRKVLKEPEASSWDGAKVLSDLYDCHTCVAHIAECFVKGIMEGQKKEISGKEVTVFGLQDTLSWEEANDIVKRVINKEFRLLPSFDSIKTDNRSIDADPTIEGDNGISDWPREIAVETLDEWLADNKSVNIVDVRYEGEHKVKKYAQALTRDFQTFMNNPYILCNDCLDMDVALCFVCNQGYKSQMAAKAAVLSGYKEVYYLGLI